MADEKSKEQERIEKLKTYNGPDRVVSSVTMAALLNELPPVVKNVTGLPALDQAIDGFENYELIVISGPTSMGKTLLCSTIARNLNDGTKYALFFTFEVTPRKLVEDFLATHHVIYLPLEHKAMDLAWLRDRVQEAILKYKVSAVFIDHLHYLVPMGGEQNMSLVIGATMRYLKRDVCLSMNVPVFLVCHSSKVQFGQKIGLEHLRDSSFVGQEADTVLMVGRREDKDFLGKNVKGSMLQGLALIHVAKARRTGNMGAEIKIKKQGHLLVESLNEPEESYADNQRNAKKIAYRRERDGSD